MRSGPTRYEATATVRFWFDKKPTSSIVEVMEAAENALQEAMDNGELDGDDFTVTQIEPLEARS